MSAFDKVIGYKSIKTVMERYCDALRHPDLYKKLGLSIPNGILLCGKPGLGKTLMAKCFIEESGCKTFVLRKEKPNGDFINEIKQTYEKAKKEGVAIVFLDDVDKFANEEEGHRNAEEYVTVQSCIDDCKELGVFTLATANEEARLPYSLLRTGRFDKVIEMYPPRGEEARQIIKHYIDKINFVGDINVNEIARLMEGKSCADLEAVINVAGLYAAFEGRDEIVQKDIVTACIRLMCKLPEYTEIEDNGQIEKVALHEAGHAVVAEVLNPGSVSLVSVYRDTRILGGVTKAAIPDDYAISKTLQEFNVMCALGGKAAIEIISGDIDVGCEEDMHDAFETVSQFVDENCAYGFDAFATHDSSQELRNRKDAIIAYEVARFYRQTKKIIIENREFLDAIKQALIDKKVITFLDMQKIRKRLFPAV